MSSRPANGSLKTITFALVGIAWGAVATADPPLAQKASPAVVTAVASKSQGARRIDWDVLLPVNERAHYNEEPPPPIHDYLGEAGKALRQSGSIAVNSRLDQTLVKIPGFVVPLVQDDTGLVTASSWCPSWALASTFRRRHRIKLSTSNSMEVAYASDPRRNRIGSPVPSTRRVTARAWRPRRTHSMPTRMERYKY